MSKIIPNSFQNPNFYVDELMPLLTGEEYKVLFYAVRRILGFEEKRITMRDRISITQFEKGLVSKDGRRLDYGTGLSRTAIVNALETLTTFNIMHELAPNNPHENKGAEYGLELDSDRVDLANLWARFEQRRSKRSSQTDTARARKAELQTPSVRQTATPSVEQTGSDEASPSVRQTAPRLSDRPHPVCQTDRDPVCLTDTQKPVGKPEENQKKETHTEPSPAASLKIQKACVCKTPHASEFCDDEREKIARSQTSIRHAQAYARSSAVRSGRDDDLLRRWQSELNSGEVAASSQLSDEELRREEEEFERNRHELDQQKVSA